jgi:hypothetical protein
MIIDGTKTQTARIKLGLETKPGAIMRIRSAGVLTQTYISIEEVKTKALGDFDHFDYYYEGRYSPQRFIEVWEEINGPSSWDEDKRVFILKFKLSNREEYEAGLGLYRPKILKEQ